MRFGVCTDVTNLDLIKSLGYDYVEFNLSKTAAMTEEEFEFVMSEVKRTNMIPETFNVAFPAEIKIACDVDMDAVRAYAEKAFSRAAKLGGKIIVVGSGKSRRIPDDYDVDVATKNLCEVFKTLSEIARKYDLRIAIEPLNPKDTNFVQTVADGVRICDMVNEDNICCLVDLFHVHMNGEDLNDIRKYGKYIIHTHLARRNEDRGAPTMADVDSIREFTDILRDIGYDSRISLEGRYNPDFPTAVAETIKLLKHLYA